MNTTETVTITGTLHVDQMRISCREIEATREAHCDVEQFDTDGLGRLVAYPGAYYYSLKIRAVASMSLATHKALYKRVGRGTASRVVIKAQGLRIAFQGLCVSVAYDRELKETTVEFKSSGAVKTEFL